jgi:N-acetylneuraminic acid mutarotase
MPTPRTEVTAATDGRRIYVVGGFTTEATVATVEVYDVATHEWAAGPALPVAVNHPFSASADGTVYVFGGFTVQRAPSKRAFVLRGDRWEEIAPIPEGRGAAGAGFLDGRIYVAGGVAPDGLGRDLLVYEIAADRWRRAPGPPTPRQHLGVAAAGGRLYVVGGRTAGADTNLNAAEAFGPAAETWTVLPDLPTPRGGLAAAATANGFVVAAGGEADSTFDEAEAYDVRANRWIELPRMPTARHGLGVVAVGNRLFALGGGPEPGLTVTGANEAVDLGELRVGR